MEPLYIRNGAYGALFRLWSPSAIVGNGFGSIKRFMELGLHKHMYIHVRLILMDGGTPILHRNWSFSIFSDKMYLLVDE